MSDTIEKALEAKTLEQLAPVQEVKVVAEKEPTKAVAEKAVKMFSEGKLRQLGWGRFARESGLTRNQVKRAYRAYQAKVAELQPVPEEVTE